MATISIFGVELPVMLDSLRIDPEHVGMEPRRNANGKLVLDRRAVKNNLSFTLAPRGLEEAMLYRELLEQRGDYWHFYSDAYSSKGLLATGTGGYSASEFVTATGQTMVLPVPSPNQDAEFGWGYAGRNGHTLVGWRTGGTARLFGWSFRGGESTATVKRERLVSGTVGPVQAYTGSETLAHSIAGQTLTVTQATGTFGFSRLVWLPRYFGQTEIDTLLTGLGGDYPTDLNRYPAPPRLIVRTDLFPGTLMAATSGLRNVVVFAEVSDINAVPHMRGGTFDKSAIAFSVKLSEV